MRPVVPVRGNYVEDLTVVTVVTVVKKIDIPTRVGNMVGNLFLPQYGTKPFPVVVVTGAWTTVKEQMPRTYANALAEKGYAALTFDFRGWGQSVGLEDEQHRYLEDPYRKSEDIQAVFKVIADIADAQALDAHRMAGLGICASAGYMSHAVSAYSSVKSLALVAPWLHNPEIIAEAFGGQENIDHLIQASRHAEKADGAVIIEAASNTNEEALMYQQPYYTEENRGLIPEYDNKFNVASWESWLTFNAVETAHTVNKPVFIVHSEKAAVPAGAKQYLKILGDRGGALWLNDAEQFDFYDVDTYVVPAIDAVAQHFDQTL